MPQVRHWLRSSVLVFAVAIILGLIAAHTSLVQPRDLQLDRSLQTDLRTGWLNTPMLGVSYVVSPVGGLLIPGIWTLWLLPRLHRIPALDRFGPLQPPARPDDGAALANSVPTHGPRPGAHHASR
ncbi:hypothetical protein ACFVT2_21475 [Streptomyces sp. NPDC058000]|uniref:hypothetical protein n=1 Tax=Streptomyces sp. NPDC058000 TaxID=3346299 RepID=UPI0036F03660